MFAGSFYNITTGNCEEKCGDGYNMGLVECDDGNTKNNDGCSSFC